MAGECGVILKVVEPVRSFVFDAIGKYVGYIGSCEDNLGALHISLRKLCDKNNDIKGKVKVGNDKQEKITSEAERWLKDVRILAEHEDLKGLMYKDIETAKFVVKMMEKKDIKRRISKDSEMQKLVVKVMKKLQEEMEHYKKEEEEMRKAREMDYNHVAEVVVEVMKNTIDDFKKLMKEDKKMAVIAMRTLKGSDLDKLTKDDLEMEEIVKEAGSTSDEELWPNPVDEESNTLQPLLVKIPEVDVGKNGVKEANKRLFTPLANLVTPLGKLMDDANFKKAVPEADVVKLGLELIDGLLIKDQGLKKELDNDTKKHRVCCCFSLLPCYGFHGRYLMSKAADFMSKHIDGFTSRYPQDPVTLPIRTQDLEPIPIFLKGLDSRTKLLDQILEKLTDDKVNYVGVFGMGGTGKTTLVKEVNMRVKDAFAKRVMVEISDAPDFVRIQATIAESIGLTLHDTHSVSVRAIKLYNQLSDVKEEKKNLIILDNVWKKLNLDKIGIPHTCKLLLTTRDRDVCRVMNVQDNNMLEVGVMNTIEARKLFNSLTGNQVDAREYKSVVERLLSKCGGLPLAIVTTVNSLKDKNLSSWVKFADDLEKPISSRISGDYHQSFTILNTSYKFIQPDGKRIFFLLACLSPPGTSVSIESLMRYGMGLNLFEHVNKLSEAIEHAVTWANELKLASMLLEGDVKGDVKIHDIVRDFAISYAAKEEEHRFMVEAIPRWLDDETLEKYTAMSLTSKNDYSRLSGVEVCKLQILILKGDRSLNLDDNFFYGMLNLKVLAVSNMNFQSSLPESMSKLKKLRTLCMEGCKLINIEIVGELVNLLVLSLRESYVESIPNEVGNLRKLRLLDLSRCTTRDQAPLISHGVLAKLSKLEGLYMYNNNRQSVFKTKSDYGEASVTENIRLPYLNALEINVAVTEELPFDAQFIKKLDKFRISVFGKQKKTEESQETRHKFSCIVGLHDINNVSGFLKKQCLKELLKKADYLNMENIRNGDDLVPQFDQEGFRNLKSLCFGPCNDAKCIVDGRKMNTLTAFPSLQSLQLIHLESLEMVCNGDVSPESFSNLQTILLQKLGKLVYGLPLVPRSLTEIFVYSCDLLKFMFIEDEKILAIELPYLRTLTLRNVPSLVSLVGPKTFSNSYDDLQGTHFLFDEKISLPSLERFELGGCKNVELLSKKIWFQNLKNVNIYDCEKLSSVGVFSHLVQLETLSIRRCKEMREVISVEEIETEKSEIGEQMNTFPRLEYLALEKLCNLERFYGGRSNLKFPKLKKLILNKLNSMKSFAKLENSSALFHEKIDFPCVEELRVIHVNDEVMGLWDKQSLSDKSNPAPMLRQLALGSSSGLRQIPSVVLHKLSSLTLADLQHDDVAFSSSDYSQLPNLEELKVVRSKSLKELFEKEDDNDTLTSFCGQLKTLELKELPELKPMPLHLFKSIASLTLFELKWNYLIPAHVPEDSLQLLQFLSIERCHNMEALVINVVGSQIKLPCLKQLRLSNLASFIGISSMPENEAALLLPSLESLKIDTCPKLEHFWSSSISAPRLEYVDVYRCANLQQFLVGNLEDTIELPSLRMVSFSSCSKFKSISTGSLTAPKLRDVRLFKCDSMQCFFPGNTNQDSDIQLPFLEIVDIKACRNLHAFSLRPVAAPKLTRIAYQYKEYSMLPYDNLNHFLKKINPINNSNGVEAEKFDK